MTWTLVVAATCVAIVTLAWVVQRSLIHFPFAPCPRRRTWGRRRRVGDLRDRRRHPAARVVRPEPEVAGDHARRVHGYGGNRAIVLGWRGRFRDGVAVLLFIFRGDAATTPSDEAGLAFDASGAGLPGDARRRRSQREGDRRVVGAAVAIGLAVEHPPRRWYFVAVHVTGRRRASAPPVPAVRGRGAIGSRISSASPNRQSGAGDCGDRDRVVPPEKSRQLNAAASAPKRLVIISGADHNDEALVYGPEVIQATSSAAAGRS